MTETETVGYFPGPSISHSCRKPLVCMLLSSIASKLTHSEASFAFYKNMASLLNPCFFAPEDSDFHLTHFCRKRGILSMSGLSDKTIDLLPLQSGKAVDKESDLCLHHEQLLIHKYEFLQKKCCDQLKIHKKAVLKQLMTVLT